MAFDHNKIRRSTNMQRPDPSDWKELLGAQTAVVSDGQRRRGALDGAIRPVTSNCTFSGPAFTIRCRPGDNAAALAALNDIQPGDVVVIANDGATAAALVGGGYAKMIQLRGAVGLVSDGPARDMDELEALGLPVFSRGISPAGPLKTGPGEIGLPITIGIVAISTGDIIVADRDGVVVVPKESLKETLEGFMAIKHKELETERMLNAGTTPTWVTLLVQELGVVDV